MSAKKSGMRNRRSFISLGLTPTVSNGVEDGSGTPLCQVGSAGAAGDPLPVNDDEAERQARRKNRVMELRQQHDRRLSPGGGSGGESYHTTNLLSGLTSSQLAEHYEDCIKLNAENKITVKNAFGLHLIDYMAEMLKKKDSDMNNFQVASCTLDASTKIYAYRVDCIHAETQKMACGLSRTSKEKRMRSDDEDHESGGDRNEDDEGGDHHERPKKKKKEAKRGKTIEKNVKALNATKFDLQLEVDPLFRKTTELFADGGAGGGVLLNSLRCRNDGCELILDSMDPIKNTHSSPEEQTTSQKDAEFVEINSFVDIFRKMIAGHTKICPSFADFEFGSWKPGDTLGTNWKFAPDVRNDSRRSNNSSNPNNDLDGTEGFPDGGRNESDGEHHDHHTPADPNLDPIHQTEQDPPERVPNMDLTQMLSTEPSEYSYFKKGFETAWAGPNHWNIKPLSKGITLAKDPKERRPRVKKPAVILNYDVDPKQFERFFGKSKSILTFAKETIKLWNMEVVTLPEDIHYKANTLYQLFTKPTAVIYKKPSCVQNADADIQNYNYENANDVENFCPNIQGDRRDDSDNPPSPTRSPGFPESNVGFDTQIDSQDGTMSQAMVAFTGDNLVQQPWRVAKFDFPLASTAKRINVRRLKENIWNVLDKNDAQAVVPLTDPGEKSFLNVYHHLPNVISSEMMQNLTVPIAFLCVLHLANEKNLNLLPQSDMKDFKIEFEAESQIN